MRDPTSDSIRCARLVLIAVLIGIIAAFCCPQLVNAQVPDPPQWEVTDWSECNCTTTTQTREVACAFNHTDVDFANCTLTGTAPLTSQPCDCTTGGLSLTIVLIGLAVGAIGAIFLFMICCYLKNCAKARLKKLTSEDDEEMTEMADEDADIENEVQQIRAKRKKKKQRRPHTHSSDARAIAARRAQQQGGSESNELAGPSDSVIIDVQPNNDTPELDSRTIALQSKSNKRTRTSDPSERPTALSPQPRHQPKGSLGPRLEGSEIEVEHALAQGRPAYVPASSSTSLDEIPQTEEVARAIYSGQLTLAPLTSNTNPLDSVKKKKKSKKHSSSKPSEDTPESITTSADESLATTPARKPTKSNIISTPKPDQF